MRDDLTVCPYCGQDYVLEAKVKKTGQIIKICFECDTVWEGKISDENVYSGKAFNGKYGLNNNIDDFEYIESRHNRSSIQLTDNIPLTVQIGSSDAHGDFIPAHESPYFPPIKYMLFLNHNEPLLELKYNASFHHLHKLRLLSTIEYKYTKGPLSIDNCEVGGINFSNGEFECGSFKTIVYANGIKILLSDKPAVVYRKTGNLYIGVSETNEIREICVCDMNEAELAHLKTVLEQQFRYE